VKGRVAVVATVAAALLLTACVRSAPVIAVEVTSPDGRELLVEVGACQAGLQIDAAEGDQRVRIAVRARGGGGGDCTQRFTLTLDEPLGDRAVIDAVTEQEVAVTR
jgi:hypothetical protein